VVPSSARRLRMDVYPHTRAWLTERHCTYTDGANHQEEAMTTRNLTRLAAVRARVERMRSELDYANRRMFEIRTGAHFIEGQEKSRGRTARRTAAHAH
jgi:hypothetical protein